MKTFINLLLILISSVVVAQEYKVVQINESGIIKIR